MGASGATGEEESAFGAGSALPIGWFLTWGLCKFSRTIDSMEGHSELREAFGAGTGVSRNGKKCGVEQGL